MNDCLIAVAPNGARKTHADHPNVPISPAELAMTARACADAGAALLHLHVRDAAQGHSLDPALYNEAISEIRSAAGPDLVVQITTEAVGRYTPAEQMAAVETVRPEACSVALREFLGAGVADDEARFRRFLEDCRAERIWVQHILYDQADIQRFVQLREQGALEERPAVLLVIGRKSVSGMTEPGDLIGLLSHLDASDLSSIDWSVCGFGVGETRILAAAAALGGHIRVGFENSHQRPDGSDAESNEGRVLECANLLSSLGLAPMSAMTLRERTGVRGA